MELRGSALDVERQPQQHHQLVSRVHRVHVVARIRFRVSSLLRFCQRVLERLAGGHPGEDVVAGAVDDRAQLQHAVRCQIVGERGNQRNPAPHRRLVAELHAAARCELRKLGSMPCQHALVRRDHRSATLERGGDQRPRRLLATDQLDHQIHVIGGRNRRRIRGEAIRRQTARTRQIANGSALQQERRPCCTREDVLSLHERARHGLPHRADAEQPDPDLLHCGKSTTPCVERLADRGSDYLQGGREWAKPA